MVVKSGGVGAADEGAAGAAVRRWVEAGGGRLAAREAGDARGRRRGAQEAAGPPARRLERGSPLATNLGSIDRGVRCLSFEIRRVKM
jgi:hypothetical protein